MRSYYSRRWNCESCLPAEHQRALCPGVRGKLDPGHPWYRLVEGLENESEVGLGLEFDVEFGCRFELDSGCEPEVDFEHGCGLDLDLVHAQPQLTQIVGQQQWTHPLGYQEL